MPGNTIVQGSQPVEYVEESTFATAVSNPAMSWIGLVTSFDVSIVTEEEIVKYLPDDADGIDLQTLTAEDVSHMYEVSVTYHPQDLAFLKYFLGGSGSLSPSLTPIQFGQQDKNNAEYNRIFGAVGESATLTIEEDSVAEIDCSFIAAATEDWTGTDYVGTGSHASADTATPLKYDDLANVQWGGVALSDSLESLTVEISNSLEVVKDPDAGIDSHIDAIVPVDREITSELGLTYSNMTMAEDVRSFTKQNLTFDFGPANESWTVYNQAFPEFPYEFGPEDLVADSVSSVPSDDLTFA
ncbi:MAG: phage tail tube protein [Halopenitus sp.]